MKSNKNWNNDLIVWGDFETCDDYQELKNEIRQLKERIEKLEKLYYEIK